MGSANVSAGILLFRRRRGVLEVFAVHPGGPFFARKDEGAWTIPKGLFAPGEELLDAARREFREETGRDIESCAPGATPIPLGAVRQRGGKTVEAWAFEGDWPDGIPVESNSFPLEWPPRSGAFREFPEVDRAQFFPAAIARSKLNPAQAEFVDRLIAHLGAEGPER